MSPIQTLETQIRKASDQYWKEGRSFLSDFEFDRLVRKLEELDPKNPLLREVGEDKTDGDKVAHRKPMLSLGKVYSWKELIDWLSKVSRSDNEKIAVSPKYDGISLEQQGDRIITRGKGYVGTDITHLAGHIGIVTHFEWNNDAEMFMNDGMSLTSILDHSEDEDEMVGELLISFERFAQLKSEYPSLFGEYKNCRNFISGFANSKRDSPINCLSSPKGCCVHIATYVYHRAYEIKTTFGELRDKEGFEQRLERELRDFQGFPTDGLVFRLMDEKYAESLGTTAHHPRGAIALKWVAEQAETVIKKIEWQVGEQHVTPVCVFDAVQIDGVLVQKATAHCAQWLKEHNVCIGSRVTIERRGGVIPKVIGVENTDPNAKAIIIDTCPECGTKLREEGKFLTCPNEHCIGKCVNKIVRGLEALGLKGIGPSLTSRVVHELDIHDIIEWAQTVGSNCDSMIVNLKEKGFTNNEISIITRINEVMFRGATPEMLLQSVCIPKCGPEFIMTVERECGGIQHLLGFAECDAMYNEIVGKCKIDALTNFMIWFEHNKERFIGYMKMFKILPGAHAQTGLNGSKGIICFTGAGPHPRDVLSQYAQGRGYQVTDNANKCTILVAEDVNGNSSKLQKARKNNIKIIDYETFSHL